MDGVGGMRGHRLDQDVGEARQPHRKKNSLFDGVCDLASKLQARCNELMAAIEVGEVWGVGRQIRAHQQAAAAIRTAKEQSANIFYERFLWSASGSY